MSDVTVAELEQQLEDTKKPQRQRDLAVKLYKNPDFKELIVDEFCMRECARLVHSSADPNLTAEQRADALAMAQAAGHLRRFLSTCVVMGNLADRNAKELETSIEEARQEAGE